MLTPERIIKMLGMKPLPWEGGYYVETYRADLSVEKDRKLGKPFSTAIYYLLTSDTKSAIHRIPTDEIFHFYLGDAVSMFHLYPDGTGRLVTLGNDLLSGQKPQVIVPKGVWQGAHLEDGGKFALMGTTVSPGFDFFDYERADKRMLLEQYPQHQEIIKKLTS